LANAGPELTLVSRHLPQNIRLCAIQKALGQTAPMPQPELITAPYLRDTALPDVLTPFKTFRKAFVVRAEKHYLQTLLSAAQNSMDNALNISGLSRSRFYDLLKQHNLSI
jgi:two-component system NtrC family response regulator